MNRIALLTAAVTLVFWFSGLLPELIAIALWVIQMIES
jgi:hypothetical protein